MTRIDLRSDTVTRPTAAMRAAMIEAPVGDDVYGDDPSVNELQAYAADLLGMEATLFLPSGTQSNLVALLSHCQRGDEYIVGQRAHTYLYEGGGGAVLGSIQPQPIEMEADGSLALERVASYIKADDCHFARTRLLCLENTHYGKVLPPDYLQQVGVFAQEHDLALHLDGARLFNAAVKCGLSAAQLVKPFDTVSICLSKGLGAPVGSLLCGSAAFIGTARRWRKMVGGGLRQAGMLAAAGRYALEHHVERLADDHRHAEILAAGLAGLPDLTVEPVQTNMVYMHLPPERVGALASYLAERHILITPSPRLRLVTHLDVDARAIDYVLGAFNDFCCDHP